MKSKLVIFSVFVLTFTGCQSISDALYDEKVTVDPVTNERVVSYEPSAIAKTMEKGSGFAPVPYLDTVLGALLAGGAAFLGHRGNRKGKAIKAMIEGVEKIKESDLDEDLEKAVKEMIAKKAREHGVEQEIYNLVKKYTK